MATSLGSSVTSRATTAFRLALLAAMLALPVGASLCASAIAGDSLLSSSCSGGFSFDSPDPRCRAVHMKGVVGAGLVYGGLAVLIGSLFVAVFLRKTEKME